MFESFSVVSAATGGVSRASVLRTTDDAVIVALRGLGAPAREVACDILAVADLATRTFASGEQVLVWLPPDDDSRGVVLGVVTPPHRAGEADPAPSRSHESQSPDTLLLEATKSITLRVGDGSIEIRADGKILIKGTDLVSHAKRMNRIKGGAVSIN
jgi:hypothetical protein